jgi:hypothetical protein
MGVSKYYNSALSCHRGSSLGCSRATSSLCPQAAVQLCVQPVLKPHAEHALVFWRVAVGAVRC